MNDEVRLGDDNEQRDVGPAELEEKTTPRCHSHAAWQRSDVLTTPWTPNGSHIFTAMNTESHQEQEQSPVVISGHILQLKPFTGENSAGPNAL